MALQLLGLAGGLLGGLIGSGKKVKVPKYTPIDAASEQSRAIAGNIANSGEAMRLAEITNEANQATLDQRLRRAIPNYDKLILKSSDLIDSGLSGEIPDDVVNQVRRNAAEKSTAGGYGDSGAARNLTARDLGVTSYDITQRALDRALQFVSTLRGTSVAATMGPEAMFVTPSQRISVAQTNATQGYNAGLQAAQANAAPNPIMANFGDFLSQAGGMAYAAGADGKSLGDFFGTRKKDPSWMRYNVSGE